MSTHKQACVVCGEPCYCCNETHALGCGGGGNGGCFNEPFIEFCSLHCALELQTRLVASIKNYNDLLESQ